MLLEGTTAEEVCSSFISDLPFGRTSYDDTSNRFQTRCTCTGSHADGYDVVCVDGCESCVSNGTLCSIHSYEARLKPEGSPEQGVYSDQFSPILFKECNDYSYQQGGSKVCMEDDLSYTVETDNNILTYTIDGEACNSLSLVTGDCGESLLVECSNLGYNGTLDFCEVDKLRDLGFPLLSAAFWNDTHDAYSVGKCADPSTIPSPPSTAGGRALSHALYATLWTLPLSLTTAAFL